MNIIKNDNKIASIIAFFLSKYNKDALKYLGYANYTIAFTSIANIIQSKYNYIKLRRDEFDVFFPDNPRKGWHKREPKPGVVKLFSELNSYSFDELSTKVRLLIEFSQTNNDILPIETQNELSVYSEIDIENIMNFKDDASICIVNTTIKQRLLNYKIIPELKKYYNHRCQICGLHIYEIYNINVSEAHHINPFIKSYDNNISNLIILCPNHHRILHVAKPDFDRNDKLFTYDNGYIEQLIINDHL